MCSLDEKLLNLGNIDYEQEYDLKKLNSFGIDGLARLVIFPKSKEELIFALTKFPDSIIIGNGTNILFVDKEIKTPIIVTKKMIDKFTIEGNRVVVSAGLNLAKVCINCAKSGLKGMENLFGIPGTIGGALYMNAGAFGSEISDYLESVQVYERGRVLSLTKDKIKFSYRDSSLKQNNIVILEATFCLKRANCEEIEKKIKENLQWRQEKQPAGKSAGSVFKKSIEPAGLLIDKAGLKGTKIGGAIVSKKHANFIINENNATADDILKLIKLIKDEVYFKFNVLLEEEIILIGDKYDTNRRFSYTL